MIQNPTPSGGLRGKPSRARPSTSGTLVPVSFAKQEKSLEQKLFVRFKDLNPEAVRVTRYRNGSIQEEILLDDPANPGQVKWIDCFTGEALLNARQKEQLLQRAIMRAPVRLSRVISQAEYQTLSDNDKSILLMSQKEYNLLFFRSSKGGTSGDQAPEGGTGVPPTQGSGGR